MNSNNYRCDNLLHKLAIFVMNYLTPYTFFSQAANAGAQTFNAGGGGGGLSGGGKSN